MDDVKNAPSPVIFSAISVFFPRLEFALFYVRNWHIYFLDVKSGTGKTHMKMMSMELNDIFLIHQRVQNGFGPAPVSHDTLVSSRGCIDPYLSFGCLSPRTVYHVIRETYKKVGYFFFKKKFIGPLG